MPAQLDHIGELDRKATPLYVESYFSAERMLLYARGSASRTRECRALRA
jgi:hypothetical protein